MMVIDIMRPVYTQGIIKSELPPSNFRSKSPTIHSGHFMVSRVHDVNNDEDEEEVISPIKDDSEGFPFRDVSREISATYSFLDPKSQPVGIDASLTKLFECMTLAYSGKITSPRWKQFRGLHLSQKQRIRLNNLIWREWHMQYIYGRKPIVCQFATPFPDHIHSKPEAVVLEGKYWKRQLDAVTAEYKKWRRYFKERIQNLQCLDTQLTQALSETELLERVGRVTFIPNRTSSELSSTDLNLPYGDIMDIDFTTDLFTCFNQPFVFPDPRELSQLGFADLIQPCLLQLQPNLEEFMDIDSMQGLFNSKINSSPLVTNPSPTFEMTLGELQSSDVSLDNFLSGCENAVSDNITYMPVLDSNNTSTFASRKKGDSRRVTFQLASSDSQYNMDPSIIVETQPSPQTFKDVPDELFSSIPSSVTSERSIQKQAMVSKPSPSSSMLYIEQQKQPEEVLPASKKCPPQQSPMPAPVHITASVNQRLQQHLFQTADSHDAQTRTQPWSLQQQQPSHPTFPAYPQQTPSKIYKENSHSRSSEDLSVHAVPSTLRRDTMPSIGKKKDGPFTVPTAKPAAATRKAQRGIVSVEPASPPQQKLVAPPPSSQVSYLAELLKSGTYPGAMISVESQFSNVIASPIQTTTNMYQHTSLTYSLNPGQHIPVSPPAGAAITFPIQIGQSVPSGEFTSRNRTSMTRNSLDSLILSGSPDSLFKESPVRYHQGTESKSPSATSLLSKNPLTSPLQIRRTPSPVDVGGFVDSLSPFPSSTPLSPSDLGESTSPGSGEFSFLCDNRRVSHISAEQKRRGNLKTGFDLLQQLVPSLSQNPKVSKATMLQKGAEYCKKLKMERAQMQKESAILKQEIDALNSAINIVQSQLPETGVPITRQRKDQMKEMFDEYVRMRTNENSNFWIFSVIMNSLYDSYCSTVSISSMEELCRTLQTWLDQSCSLVTLRPNALNALRKLSTSTPILTEPQKMKEHALQAVARRDTGYHKSNMMAK